MKSSGIVHNIKEHPILYMMVLPGIVYFILFYLLPVIGNIIAWMDYNYILGIANSPWVGWKHFETMFGYSEFFRILRNTVVIGVLQILLGFPIPLILALFLNEIRSNWFKRFGQTVVFIPYFLSWVIVARLVYSILHPESGIFNLIMKAMGGESVFYMAKSELFPLIVVIAGSWQSAGYACIVYLAALTTIDPSLYEAAEIDGASRWQQTIKITIPFLIPPALVMLLLNIGNFLNTGYNQIETLYNPLVRDTGEILVNYIYNVGINKGRYSFASAVGIFQAIIGLILVLGGHFLSLKLTGRGLFYVPKSDKKQA
jgi:putative aldouronate transport system permease protein